MKFEFSAGTLESLKTLLTPLREYEVRVGGRNWFIVTRRVGFKEVYVLARDSWISFLVQSDVLGVLQLTPLIDYKNLKLGKIIRGINEAIETSNEYYIDGRWYNIDGNDKHYRNLLLLPNFIKTRENYLRVDSPTKDHPWVLSYNNTDLRTSGNNLWTEANVLREKI